MMDVNATLLYPSAMCDENSVYPKTESGYALTLYLNDVFLNDF